MTRLWNLTGMRPFAGTPAPIARSCFRIRWDKAYSMLRPEALTAGAQRSTSSFTNDRK